MLGPVAASLVQVLLSPKRELAADAAAARICGTPHGLADALVRLEQAQELVAYEASPVTEPLYTLNPFEPVGVAALFTTHPPVAERVETAARARPGLARAAPGCLTENKGAALATLCDEKPAASYSPGRLPSEYHRRWRA